MCGGQARLGAATHGDADVGCVASECDITLADEGDADCSEGATCSITCTDDCTVACRDSSVCEIRCAGETEYTPVEGAEGRCIAGG